MKLVYKQKFNREGTNDVLKSGSLPRTDIKTYPIIINMTNLRFSFHSYVK